MAAKSDYSKLTAEERLTLIGETWDSLESKDLPLTDAQRSELDRRRDDLNPDSLTGIPWEQVREQIESRPK